MQFKKTFSESGFSALGKVTGKNRWRARIVKTGTGSTGVYTESALKTTGPVAFPVGTKINADHAGFEDRMEQPAGSVKTLIGATVSEATFVVEEGTGIQALEAEVEFSEEWAPFVEQFHEILGLSIHAEGYGTEYSELGMPIIEGFIPSPLNTVDLVTVAGAGGKLIELVESYKAETHGKMVNEDLNDRKDDGMKPEEIQALIDGIVKALKPEPVQTEAGPTASEISEALVVADLPKSARDRVYVNIENGIALDKAIENEKTYISELSESLKKSEEANKGKVVTEGDTNFLLNQWGSN